MSSPLGGYPQFSRWGVRQTWGAQGEHGAILGPGVVDDLVDGLARYAAGEPCAAAIGCVAFFTHFGLARQLASLSATCIVIDKGTVGPASCSLHDADNSFPIQALSGLGGMVTATGDDEVGPVRLAGVGPNTAHRPLLHAKLMILGKLFERLYNTGVGEYAEWTFEPKRLWLGSANWTQLSAQHLELGLWIDDPALIEKTTDFAADVIRFSEPFDSRAAQPTPELTDYEPDYETLMGLREEDPAD